ncbi:hypothetical protein F01_290079 [Burkholderia cenocepacia]|nr:hypothetical protein F01_290079 [Burkholderia cenocepacia]
MPRPVLPPGMGWPPGWPDPIRPRQPFCPAEQGPAGSRRGAAPAGSPTYCKTAVPACRGERRFPFCLAPYLRKDDVYPLRIHAPFAAAPRSRQGSR